MNTTLPSVQSLIDRPFTPEQRADLQSCVSNEADFGFEEVWSGINEGVNEFVNQLTFNPETDEPLCEEGTDEYKQLTETLREKAFALISVKDVKVETLHQTATDEQQQSFPKVADPINLVFTEEQLYNLYVCVENEVQDAWDSFSAGMMEGVSNFASNFENLTDANGNLVVKDSPEWENWVEAINEMLDFGGFEVDGFDLTSYYRRRLEARQLNAN